MIGKENDFVEIFWKERKKTKLKVQKEEKIK